MTDLLDTLTWFSILNFFTHTKKYQTYSVRSYHSIADFHGPWGFLDTETRLLNIPTFETRPPEIQVLSQILITKVRIYILTVFPTLLANTGVRVSNMPFVVFSVSYYLHR